MDSLETLRQSWNRKNPDDPIPASVADKADLWKAVRDKMRRSCTSEYCWTKSPVLSKTASKQLQKRFRPEAPASWSKKPREWLSSDDIDRVMQQYEETYKDFSFLGCVPIDFDQKDSFGQCVVDQLCAVNLRDMQRRGKRRFGVVFNLDPHDKPGSHWMALFIDLTRRYAAFFDSFGVAPTKEIVEFMKRVRTQMTDKDND
jgi:hypothetical protein